MQGGSLTPSAAPVSKDALHEIATPDTTLRFPLSQQLALQRSPVGYVPEATVLSAFGSTNSGVPFPHSVEMVGCPREPPHATRGKKKRRISFPRCAFRFEPTSN
jgi:hypothetical protein